MIGKVEKQTNKKTLKHIQTGDLEFLAVPSTQQPGMEKTVGQGLIAGGFTWHMPQELEKLSKEWLKLDHGTRMSRTPKSKE